MNKKVRNTASILGITLTTILTTILLTGHVIVIGTGNSMQPNMSNPSISLAETNPDKIQEGDVIGDNILHRVTKIREKDNQTQIIRKGDNNNHYDTPITPDEADVKIIKTLNIPYR